MIENENFSYKFDETVCSTCEGNCCIGESGYIWITSDEIEKLAKYLCISVDEVINQYLYKYGHKFSIKEKMLSSSNFACIFFDVNMKRCRIYEARPLQCKTFPFWNHFKNNIQEVKQECSAIVEE